MTRFLTVGQCATALALILCAPAVAQTATEQADQCASDTYTVDCTNNTVLDRLVVRAASEELKQSLGVSNITAEDLENHPTGRDISEIVRTMPGVNLTGNTASGQRGNNRQIDIRGMGPENTLILIDGKPVLSRNSVRMGRRGERDTRGDSSWVPSDQIERIEVIRGPAAARYGSGAAGGVVNIITKRPETTTVTVSTYIQVPEHSDEGGTKRASVTVGGPINDIFSYRLSADVSRTDPDAPDINDEAADTTTSPAGREGVIQYDVRGLWSAQIDPDNRIDLEASYSRQGNIYSGDTLLSSSSASTIVDGLAESGAETNKMERTTLSLSHFGTYDFGDAESFVQWEHTTNTRLTEGTAGAAEGRINSETAYETITLDNINAKSEWDIPVYLLRDQTVTLGVDYRGEFMDDAGDQTDAHLLGLYAEDNIMVTDQFTLTPGLRFDAHSTFGINLSPSLNASYALTDEITIKGGIARAFKAPNLFQLNPNYLYSSNGNGCPAAYSGSCYIIGNPDLDPEISINKEIGISYANVEGWQASATYFHNDYENRIAAGDTLYATTPRNTFRWENSGPAIISGLEGNLTVPLLDTLTWTTNATYMIESKDKETGQPLSLVPEYTINTSLRWQATEEIGLTASATHYGKIRPYTLTVKGVAATDESAYEERDPYTIFNLSADYKPNDKLTLSAGVNNLFDERLFRTGEGANTYNEPGRSYWVSLTGSF